MASPGPVAVLMPDRLADWINLAQFIFLLVWSVITLRIARGDRKEDSRSLLYRKLVVNHAVEEIPRFKTDWEQRICRCATPEPSPAEIERLQAELSQFGEASKRVRDQLFDRVVLFNPAKAKEAADIILVLEDSVSGWFDANLRLEPYERRESLPDMFTTSITKLMELILEIDPRKASSPKKKGK